MMMNVTQNIDYTDPKAPPTATSGIKASHAGRHGIVGIVGCLVRVRRLVVGGLPYMTSTKFWDFGISVDTSLVGP